MGCTSSINTYLDLTYFTLKGIKSRGQITRIVDGDTFDMALEIKTQDISNIRVKGKVPLLTRCHTSFMSLYKCRLLGVDTAEKNTEKGKLAIEYLKKLCQENNFTFDCLLGSYDKYGRLLVSIYTSDGLDVSELIISNPDNFAKPYYGGKKESFD